MQQSKKTQEESQNKQMEDAQVRQIQIQLEMERLEQMKKKMEEKMQMKDMMRACELLKNRKELD